MSDEITALQHFDDASLDTAFSVLAEEVRTETASLADPEAFRLHWLGRKQGRLKLISEAWLKSAPPEAKKALGIRFNQLKQQIEAALEAPTTASTKTAVQGIDITLPGSPPGPRGPPPPPRVQRSFSASARDGSQLEIGIDAAVRGRVRRYTNSANSI